MPTAYWSLLLACGVVLSVFLLLDRPWRNRSLLLLTAAMVSGSIWVGTRVTSEARFETKTSVDTTGWVLVGLLYIATVLGMAAQYFFFKSERSRFRWNRFIRPFLASPIVFIPLVGTLSEDDMGLLPFSLAKLMLLLIAFQNGFFWQTFFDSARQKASKHAGT